MATRRTPLGWDIDSFTPVKWVIPGTGRHLMLHPVFGFIATVYAVWYNRVIERINPIGNEPWDEWGYAKRENRNDDSWSEHGGCAWDLNAAAHPNGVPANRTFTSSQLRKMRYKRAAWNAAARTDVIRLGIDYKNTPDGMHGELYHKPLALKRLMRIIAKTTDGRAVLKANPGKAADLKKRGYV